MADYKTRSDASTSHEGTSSCGHFRIHIFEHSESDKVQWDIRETRESEHGSPLEIRGYARNLKTAKLRIDEALPLLSQLAEIRRSDADDSPRNAVAPLLI